jgi:hypothetical protein
MINSFVVAPQSRAGIEGEAEDTLAVYFPEHLSSPGALDVERLADFIMPKYFGYALEIVPRSKSPLSPYEEAKMDPDQKKILISEMQYEALLRNDHRARFTMCHECGHVIMHSRQMEELTVDQILTGIHLMRSKQVPKYRDSEWQADYFAGAILMPRATMVLFVESLQRAGLKKDDIIMQIMKRYCVSFTAAGIRYSILIEKK